MTKESTQDQLNHLKSQLTMVEHFERESTERWNDALQTFRKTILNGETMADWTLRRLSDAKLYNEEVMSLKRELLEKFEKLEEDITAPVGKKR